MTRPGFVYVAEAENGMVKIGYSNDPVGRVKAICSGSPMRVRLVAFLPAKSRADERMHHRKFAASRAWNEWFRPSGNLSEFLNEISGRGIERVLEWEEIVSTHEARAAVSKKHGDRLRALWADPVYRASRVSWKQIPNIRRPPPISPEQTIEGNAA